MPLQDCAGPFCASSHSAVVVLFNEPPKNLLQSTVQAGIPCRCLRVQPELPARADGGGHSALVELDAA